MVTVDNMMTFISISSGVLLTILLQVSIQHVQSEQPVAVSHKSYFQFDNILENTLEHESRSKRRAIPVALSATQAEAVVSLHNGFRSTVVPHASNMEYMKWDADLARMAMRYSQQCHWGHGNVQNVSPHNSVGQNLWIQGLSSRDRVPNPTSGINAWFSEVRHYNYDTHECTSPNQCGHYTQLVWAETTSVGCGLAYCPMTSNWTYSNSWIMTCYYGPASGNYIGVKPYTSGPSCTQCKSEVGQCFDNLCRLCNEHAGPCDCRQQCVNCGAVDQYSCTCICQDGWYGPDCGNIREQHLLTQAIECSEFCNETHPNCNKDPGWPGPSYCGHHSQIPRLCPKMCGLCVDPNPLFTCVLPTTSKPAPNPPAIPPPAGTLRPNPPQTYPPRTNPPIIPATLPPRNPPVYPPVTQPHIRPTIPRVPPVPGPTAVDCKIPCLNGGTQNLITCKCMCILRFTGTYCQHDTIQINNGAMLRLVGDIRQWGIMEYDMHQAIEQSVDVYCNGHKRMCCPQSRPTTAATAAQLNYIDMANVVTGTGFPEVDAHRADSYWILLVATEPKAPQLCTGAAERGAAVQPSMLLDRNQRKRGKRDGAGASNSEESDEDGGAPAPVYVDKAIMLNSVDQNMAAIKSVLMMYDVKLAEVQRGQPLKSDAISTLQTSSMVMLSALLLCLTAVFI